MSAFYEVTKIIMNVGIIYVLFTLIRDEKWKKEQRKLLRDNFETKYVVFGLRTIVRDVDMTDSEKIDALAELVGVLQEELE